ncbi:MAG: LamG domain-containing protein, partial [Dehalococcoidales bacterium]|nr:LamG domain-containing protein [Dehalococcoidales bacterium]
SADATSGTDEFAVDGRWHHVAMTYDDAGDRYIRVYIDGTEVSSYITRNACVDAVLDDSGEDLILGENLYGNITMDGRMDELRVWNVARTAAQIRENMYKQLVPSTESNLVAYWRFNENTGTTAYDETANSNDGTISNAFWQKGFMPDYYNEAEGIYPAEASGSQVNLDINGTNLGEGSILFDDANSEYLSVSSGAVTDYPFTMAAWVWSNDLPASGFTSYPIISLTDVDDGYDRDHISIYANNGAPRFDAFTATNWDATGRAYSPDSASNLASSTWYHVCGVFASGSSRIVYTNGGFATSNTTSLTPNTRDTTSIAARVNSGGPSSYLSATVAEAAIWNVALTNAQCSQLAAGAFPDEVQAGNLQGYWPLYSISDITDKAGDSDMTAYNTPTSASRHPFLAPRHKPQFKIRSYQQNSKPYSVTLEGASLVEGTDYNVDYVPVADAYFADELTWYSSCESTAAFETPDVGSGGSDGAATFVEAKYGKGIQVDADNEEPYFPSSSNISGTAGVVEFWFKETGTPAATGAFFASDNGSGTINMELARGGNDTDIDFTIDDGSSHVNSWDAVTVNIYDGGWHHVRLEYDAATDTPDLYLDSILQTRDATSAWNAITPQTNTYIGDVSSSDRNIAGIIDEFRVYSPASGGIDDLAAGGNTADSDEYLFDEDSDYTLDFEAVDASSRGEYFFLGADSMYSGINVDLATVGATGGTLNLDWEYWNGYSWSSLESITGFTDGTSNLTQDGAVYWTISPTNWRPYSVNGGADLYYIRCFLNNTSGSYTTSPIENFIKTDILILQYLGTVSSVDQTLVVVPEFLWPLLTVIPFIPAAMRKRSKKKRLKKRQN